MKASLAALTFTLAAFGCDNKTEKNAGVSKQASSESVQFLVDSCVEASFSEKSCACVGEAARKDLDAELIAKWKNAPTDRKELEAYFSKLEVQTMVEFMGAASSSCGVN